MLSFRVLIYGMGSQGVPNRSQLFYELFYQGLMLLVGSKVKNTQHGTRVKLKINNKNMFFCQTLLLLYIQLFI